MPDPQTSDRPMRHRPTVNDVSALYGRAYSNGAVQPILCSPKSRMCSPSYKIVQSKICALNFHTNQQQELFPHLLHLQRWQVGNGNLFILQVGGVYRISQSSVFYSG